MLGKIESRKRRGQQDEIVGCINGHEFEQTPGDSEGQEAWNAAVLGVAESWT